VHIIREIHVKNSKNGNNFSEIGFKNTPVGLPVKNKNKTKYSLIKQINRFLLSCILGVLKHEHVSSDIYTTWTRVLHEQCLWGK